MNKKLISCLLAVIMLFTVAGGFAEEYAAKVDNALVEFLKETDMSTKDLALQIQSGDENSDLVIRIDGTTLHLVSRQNGNENGHVQLNPTGIYAKEGDGVTMIKFTTLTKVLEDVLNTVNNLLDEAAKSLAAESKVSNEQVQQAVAQLNILAKAAAAQEQADAMTVSSAATTFADKFKPEYILDVKEEDGKVEINLRADAFATAFADALDSLMSNADLAELIDRKAAANNGKTFAEYQREWAENREETLAKLRSIESFDKVEENGHWTSHFQIGEENSETKIMIWDTDSWIDAEEGELETKATLSFKDEDPLLVYELEVSPDNYSEKMTADKDFVESQFSFAEDGRITEGYLNARIDDKDELNLDFDEDHFNIKGPKGGLSTSVRETWTGKIRYEIFFESAEGQEASFIIDFYEDGDSLVCELKNDGNGESAVFKVSRIDRIDMADLAAAENINEITVENIISGIETILKLMAPAGTATTEAAK